MADGMSKLRLDKYLADMGVGTRQEVKALVPEGTGGRRRNYGKSPGTESRPG